LHFELFIGQIENSMPAIALYVYYCVFYS